MEQTPIFTRLDIPTVYDTSVEESLIIEIPSDSQSVQNLNQANTQLRFVYPGDFIYYLNSSDSGFIVRLRYRTRLNNNNSANANITLSSNWFAYLFNDIEFKLGGQSVERISHPGIVMDCFSHMEDNEFRTKNGELIGFIPDTSDEINDVIGTRQGAVAGADLAAAIISTNADANKIVRINNNYNDGFIKRKKLYNYTIAADDDYRDIEMFIPLNRLFSFCEEFNRVLKYIPLEIVLTRSGNNTHAFYGAANTGVTFVDNDVNNSGIISITLQLERIKFSPDIESDLEKNFKKPFEVSYYKRICEASSTIPTASRTFSHQKMISEKDEGNVRYVFCIFKTHADDTVQTNYQRCCNADISKITVRYGSQEYPQLAQNAEWSRNYFSRFYKEFLRVSASLGYMNPALSMQEFRDLYTVYAIDTSSQANVSTTNSLTIDVQRHAVPAQGAATLANPRELDALFVIITESKIQIDCINKVIRRN